jgi:nucleotide-binding universal stress UspA family protein
MQKIYIPICGASEAKRAIQKGIETAKRFDLEAVVINVLDQESINKLQRYKIFVDEESAMFSDSLKRDAEKYLHYAEKIAEGVGISVKKVLLEGDPFSEIIEYIKNDSADARLVCIAKRRESQDCRDLFGVVERKLLSQTDFDLIVAGEQ